jgi:hypothetical protein
MTLGLQSYLTPRVVVLFSLTHKWHFGMVFPEKANSYHLSPHQTHPPITIPALKIIGGLLIALGLFFVCRLKVCPC